MPTEQERACGDGVRAKNDPRKGDPESRRFPFARYPSATP